MKLKTVPLCFKLLVLLLSMLCCPVVADTVKQDYHDALIMENGRPLMYQFDGGYCSLWDKTSKAEELSFHYYTKDHLGNNRAVVNESGSIEQTTHYYPFGNSIADIGTNASLQQYKYNGKELDRMHGLDWYDYGARNYDPAILQWDRPDLLAEKYYPVSLYVYCVDNPVSNIDPDGNDVLIWYKDNQGNDCSFRFTGFHGKSSIVVPRNQFVKDFIMAYNFNLRNGGGDNLRKAVTCSKYEIDVVDATLYNRDTSFDYLDHDPKVLWESRRGLETTNGGKQSAATRLEHEFDHAVHWCDNKFEHVRYKKAKDSQYDTKEERRVITGSETKTAKANGEAIRTNHDGVVYDTIDPISIMPLY